MTGVLLAIRLLRPYEKLYLYPFKMAPIPYIGEAQHPAWKGFSDKALINQGVP